MLSLGVVMIKKLLILSLALFSLDLYAASLDQEIQTSLNSVAEAMNNRNLEAVLSTWTKDGEMITLAGGIYNGKDELQKLFSETFANPYKQAKYQLLVNSVRADGASRVIVDGIWKTENAGSANYPTCGIFLYHFKKQSGAWKVELASSSVPRQGHTAEHGRKLSWVKACKEPIQRPHSRGAHSSAPVSRSD